MENEGGGATNFSLYAWKRSQKLGKMTAGIGNQRKSRDNLDHSTIMICYNT